MASEDLVLYILDARKQDARDEEIEQVLVENGWTEEGITKAFGQA